MRALPTHDCAISAASTPTALAFSLGVKAILRSSLVPAWWEEVAAEKSASADMLAAALNRLDQQPAEASALTAANDDATAAEQRHWERFSLLRTWVRLGLPARPPAA
jgi:hypothetical protein